MIFEQLVTHVYDMFTASHTVSMDQPFLLAVSGGVDSMVMLRVFMSLRDQYGVDFKAIHINHQLRPQASSQEQADVITYCEDNQVELAVRIWRHEGMDQMVDNVEAMAREFRYQNFAQLMKTDNIKQLITAHHKNDQAETVLMRLINGGRLDSIVGIKPISPLYSWQDAQVIRPFLGIEKSDLYQIAQIEGIPYAEDESNQDLDFTRNRIRHHYIPLLEAENSNVVDHLANFAMEGQGLLAFANQYIEQILPSLLTERLGDWQIDLKALRGFDQGQQIRLLQVIFAQTKAAVLLQFSRKGMVDLLAFLNGNTAQGEWSLPGDYRLVKVYNTAYIMDDNSQKIRFTNQVYKLSLNEWQEIRDEETLRIGAFNASLIEAESAQFEQLIVDRDQVKNGIVVRHRQPGDYIQLSDSHHQKLRRYFINEKLPQDIRDQAWLITTNDHQVLAICTVDETYRIDFTKKSTFNPSKDLILYYNFY